MNERIKRVLSGTGILLFIVAGVLEYIQLMYSFDLPQIMLVMPLLGALGMIVWGKKAWIIPVGVALLSCMYQIVAGEQNAVSFLQTDASGVWQVIFYVLPYCLLFELIGMGGGALIRVLTVGKKKKTVGILCLIVGILITVLPYTCLFRNPLYPIQARMTLSDYADTAYGDYEISGKNYYFNLSTSCYECRIVMSDGVIRTAVLEDDGTVRNGE